MLRDKFSKFHQHILSTTNPLLQKVLAVLCSRDLDMMVHPVLLKRWILVARSSCKWNMMISSQNLNIITLWMIDNCDMLIADWHKRLNGIVPSTLAHIPLHAIHAMKPAVPPFRV